MADNVQSGAAVGSGATFRTDEIAGSLHVPFCKLMDGTADATTVIAAGGGVEAGALRVTIASDSTGVVSIDDNGGTLTVDAPVGTPAFVRLSDGSAAITTLPVSLASVPSHAVTNAGTFATQATCTNAGTFAVQIDAGAVTSLALIDDVIFADDAAFTPGTSKVAAVGMQADETATDSVDEGDVGCPRITLDRKQIVTMQPHTAGGTTTYSKISVGTSGDATNIKASAGKLYGYIASNVNAAPAFLKFYDSASAPTAGSGTPVLRILIPGNTAGVMGHIEFPNGIAFASGIGFTIVTTAPDAGATGVVANEVLLNVLYK